MPQEDLYRQIVDSFSDGIVVLGFDGVIRYANEECGRLLGVAADAMAGMSVDGFLDAAGRVQSRTFLQQAAGGDFLTREVDSMFLTADGEPIWVRLKQTPLQAGPGGAMALRISPNQDRKDLLEQLARGQGELERAERIARLGSWTWDLVNGTVSHSPGLVTLFGSFTNALLSQDFDTVATITHAEDLPRLRKAIVTLKSGLKPRVDIELRQRGESGWMWVRMRALATYDTDGELVSVSGTHQDITRARATEDQLQDQVTQNSLMQAVASAANEATTLDEVLVHAQSLVVLHDDWERARAFVPSQDGLHLVPRYYSDEDRAIDLNRADVVAREVATANRCLAAREAVWDDGPRLTIAFPILLGDEVLAVVTISSLPPIHRHDMIRAMVEQAALQLSQVAERERAARELAAARDRAIEASRHKSEFLATMSHEIRTPLNGITGLTELLGRTVLDSQQRHLVSGIAVSGRSLLGIINDILDFSKIEAGHLEVETIDFEVREVLDQVSGVLAESAHAKGLALQVSCHPDVPEVLGGDPGRLAQVITNLGSNAVKFTPRGSVTIRATSAPLPDGRTTLRVDVRDTGVGVPEAQRKAIFRPFMQADSSTTRRFGGTGLGLAISSELVEAFGGEIGVESSLGEGSTFWFTAQLAPASGSRSDAMLRRTRDKLGRTKVLIVDDIVQNRLILREQLSWWHAASTGVDSASAALDALRAAADTGDPFDGVLLDLAMPENDGIALARTLRGDDRFIGLPIVLLSSMSLPPELDLEAIGIVESLTKPVQASALREVLLRVLTGGQDAAPPTVPGPLRVGHLLVVEDNPVNQIVARGLLTSMGYTVDTADDGEEALDQIAANSYAAVLMDLQMPRLDGYGAVRRLREDERSAGRPRLPVLAMTAAAISGEREKCLAAGMDDFITKPVAPASLAAALDRWVPQREGAALPEEPSPSTPGPQSHHLDLDRLEMLRELSPDDNAYLDRVIDGFAGRSPGVLQTIETAVGAGDAAKLAAEAHSVKGSALNIGLPTVAEISKDLESLGRAGTVAGAQDLVLRLGAALTDANEALAAYRDWYRSLPPGS